MQYGLSDCNNKKKSIFLSMNLTILPYHPADKDVDIENTTRLFTLQMAWKGYAKPNPNAKQSLKLIAL